MFVPHSVLLELNSCQIMRRKEDVSFLAASTTMKFLARPLGRSDDFLTLKTLRRQACEVHQQMQFAGTVISARERERFTTSIQPAWLMRTGLCSCLSLLQQGNETMADRLLVLVPHEHTHAPRSILEQARKLGPDVTEMRAIKHTMELIAHSLCIAKRCTGKGGAGGLTWQNGPAQWAEYGDQL